MSIVNQVEIFPAGVQAIQSSKYDFYLTGSRYFGTGDAKRSDWDFFVYEHYRGIRDFLSENGFKRENITSYSNYGDDGFCAEVWYRKDGPRGCDMIHVQLVHDAKLKNRAQRIIRESINPELLKDKRISKAIWSMMFNVLTKNN